MEVPTGQGGVGHSERLAEREHPGTVENRAQERGDPEPAFLGAHLRPVQDCGRSGAGPALHRHGDVWFAGRREQWEIPCPRGAQVREDAGVRDGCRTVCRGSGQDIDSARQPLDLATPHRGGQGLLGGGRDEFGRACRPGLVPEDLGD